jgi:hypothetical protein
VTAAFFRMETNQAPETLPGLYRDFHSLLKPGESALQRTVHAWIVEVVHRAFPDGIMPEG